MAEPSEATDLEEKPSEDAESHAEETKSMGLDEKMQWARKKGVQPEALQAVLQAGDFKKYSP